MDRRPSRGWTRGFGSLYRACCWCVAALLTTHCVSADPPTTINDSSAVAARVLELVNDARAESRRCGRRLFEAVAPLTPSRSLTEAASVHARDMAEHGSLDHRGSDGSEPAERVARAGYRWRAVGENVAAGQPSAEAVVDSWLASSGHCANIMAPQFTETGVAFAPVPSGNPSIYWAQVFAAPE